MKKHKLYTMLLAKKYLRKLILIIMLLIIFFTFSGHEFLLKYNKKNIYKIKETISLNNKNFNIDEDFEKNIINNNKVSVISVYDDLYLNYAKNIEKSNSLIKLLGEQINVINFVVKKKKESNQIYDIIYDLIDDDIDKIIFKNSVKYPIFYFKNKIDFEENKIYIYDEKFNLKAVFDDNVALENIIISIKTISREKKILKKKDKYFYDYKQPLNIEEDFIGEFIDFVLVEKSSLQNFPFFVILDSIKKQILLAGFDGKIFDKIELTNSCLPNKIKFINENIYYSDSCKGEINFIKKDKKIVNILKSESILNINDFIFIDKNNILISKEENNGIIKYNLINKQYINLIDNIGKVSNLEYFNNKFYFFDKTYNVLYYIDNDYNIKKIVDLHDKNLINNINKISVVDDKNLYFVSTDNNLIYYYDGNSIKEKTFNSFLYRPKNVILYRNIYYILSDNNIQQVDFYTNKKNDLKLSFSKLLKLNINDFFSKKTLYLENSNDIIKIGEKVSIKLIYDNSEYAENSPSFLALFKIVDDKTIKFIKNFQLDNADSIFNFEVEKNNNNKYFLYGNIYYYNESGDLKIKNIKEFIQYNDVSHEKNIIFLF